MKNSEQYLKKLLRKSINETLEEKANKLMGKIKGYEMGEGFDSPEIKISRGGEDFNPDEFKKIRFPREKFKGFDDDSMTQDEFDYRESMRDFEDEYDQEQMRKELSPEEEPYIKDDADYYLSDEDEDDEDDDDDMDTEFEGGDMETIMEGNMCEQCGSGSIREGECNECGYRRMDEGIYDESEDWGDGTQDFDYVQAEDDEEIEDNDDILEGYCNKNSRKYDQHRCEVHKEMMEGEINEKLYGGQKKLDKNKNGKIDSSDFKLLRKKNIKGNSEKEMEEGNKFTGMLAKARKGDKFTLDGKTYTDKSNYDVNESIEYRIKDNLGDFIRLNESELIDFIENIVNEQKTKLKVFGKPKGLTTYEKAHKESGKENEEYFKSLNKKMKDYLKDGSKGKFEMEPKHFPKGNGELAKMDKKAYKMTDDLEDFNYEIGGQNFPVPDAIDYNEDWMDKLFQGDSMTGNAPGGNALESETNKRFNKMRKKNTLKKIKDQSYKRVPQPVFNEKPGNETGKGLGLKLETIETKKVIKLNEEFDKIKNLFSYNRKTQ